MNNTLKIILFSQIVFLYTLCLLFIPIDSQSQCNETLVQKAISASGKDSYFLKEFKVKSSHNNMSRPLQVAKFQAYLKEGITYRMNVENSEELAGKAMLQLIYKGKILGNTYDIEMEKDSGSFDFNCKLSATYQIYMSFYNNEQGCSVGILSAVQKDSLAEVKENPPVIEPQDILYIGVDNFITIASDNEQNKVTATITKGEISDKENNEKLIRVFDEGITSVNASEFDNSGNLIEEVTIDFTVKKIPIPGLTISGVSSGYISKDVLINSTGIDLLTFTNLPDSDYTIKSFGVSDVYQSKADKETEGNKFSIAQKNLIKKAVAGSKIYIINAIVVLPDKREVRLNNVEFILY